MSEPSGLETTGAQRADDPVLTPKAAAIAGLVLAVLTLEGQGGWTAAVTSFFGTAFEATDYATVVGAGAVANIVLAVGALWLCRAAISAGTRGSWEQHVGRAGRLLAVLGGVLAAFTLVGTLLSS